VATIGFEPARNNHGIVILVSAISFLIILFLRVTLFGLRLWLTLLS
jgi:hypothetical protein